MPPCISCAALSAYLFGCRRCTNVIGELFSHIFLFGMVIALGLPVGSTVPAGSAGARRVIAVAAIAAAPASAPARAQGIEQSTRRMRTYAGLLVLEVYEHVAAGRGRVRMVSAQRARACGV